jgi:hypothetical protein
MGYCKRSRAPLLAKIARIKLQAISCDSQGTTPLGLAQLEFANIEMYFVRIITQESNARLVLKMLAHNSMSSLIVVSGFPTESRVLPYASRCGLSEVPLIGAEINQEYT